MDATSSTTTAARSLVWLDRFLKVVTAVFAIGTVAFVATLVPLVTGSAGVGVDGTIEPPLTIATPDGAAIDVAPSGEVAARTLDLESARIDATMRLGEDDTDARLVVALSGVALIAAFWTGLIVTRRIVRSARDGDPFDARNVTRLRVLAALFVLVPVGTQITAWLLEAAVETAPDVQVAMASPDWGILLVVALGLLALAQVFREGVTLRDLDRTTI